MKNKTNFTYKEFIQKLSNVATPKQLNKQKSLKVLNEINKNNSIFNDNFINEQKQFFQKNTVKQSISLMIYSPTKNNNIQNDMPVFNNKNYIQKNNKSTIINKNYNISENQSDNNKNYNQIYNQNQNCNKNSVILKKINNKNTGLVPTSSSSNLTINQRHNKSVRQNKNIKILQNKRHLQSCLTFYKQDNNQSSLFQDKNQRVQINHLNLKLKAKNTQKNHIKIKQGNLTQRNYQKINKQYDISDKNQRINTKYNQRINTQYKQRINTEYYQRINIQYNQRVNTQYNQNNIDKYDKYQQNRKYPSFYQKSTTDQANFIDFQDNDTIKNLFDNSNIPRTKSMSYQNQKQSQQKQKIKLNQKSNQYAYNKFITQINDVLTSITKISDQSLLLQHKIKYIQYLESLKELKMINNDYQPYSQTEGLDIVRQFWQQLIVGHTVNHFIVILSILLKVSPLSYLKQQNSKDFHNYVYLQKKYQYFRSKKLQLSRTILNFDKKQKKINFNLFKKQETNRQLTPKSKSKKKYIINPQNYQKQQQNNGILDLKMGISQHNNISLNTEYDQSFINYNLNITSPSVSKTSRSPLGKKRSQILYQQGRKKSLQKKFDKSTADYQYERNAKELTFKPKLIVKKKIEEKFILQNNKSPRIIADEEKTINRMIRGRIQKEVKQITIGKGHPYNQKLIQKMKKQKYQQVLKQMHQSKIKHIKKINLSKSRKTDSDGSQNKLNEQAKVQQVLLKMLDLSFQDVNNKQEINEQHTILQNNSFMQKQIINDLFPNQSINMSGKKSYKDNQEEQVAINNQVDSENLFILDIYIGEDQCQKLQIRRDASFQEVNEQAERFVLKHNLSSEMYQKLKNELIIAMKFHNLQKIDENAEQQQYSLLM